jgi:hypothetical protein
MPLLRIEHPGPGLDDWKSVFEGDPMWPRTILRTGLSNLAMPQQNAKERVSPS